MPTTIVNSDGKRVSGTGGSRVLDSMQNGYLWFVTYEDNVIYFYYSTDNGANWQESTASRFTGPPTPVQPELCFFIDKDNNAHLLYGVGFVAGPVYVHGVVSSDFKSFTWQPAINIGGGSQDNGQGHDIVAFRAGTGWVAHAIHNEYNVGATAAELYWTQINITSAHACSVSATTSIMNYGGLGSAWSAMDFRHTESDSKDIQAATPHLYVIFTCTGVGSFLFFKKISYSAGVWTVGAQRTIDGVAQASNFPVNLVYDGTRVMMSSVRSASDTVMRCYERDEADTTTTNRDPTALSDGTIYTSSLGLGKNGDVWLVARAATSFDFKKIRFNRAGVAWAASWTLLEADTTSADHDCTIGRGMSGDSLGVVYEVFSPIPNQARYDALFTAHDSNAFLQGIGSVTSQGNIGFVGQASLQGVATVTPSAALGYNPPATLQGVATMSPTTLFTPKKDFTVYDGYIDNPVSGTIPFIYFEDEGAKPQTTSVPLRPPRTDTGQEPTEVRPESGEVFSQQDFSHGAGQLYFHHEGRDVRRFLWSEGFEVEIDTVGQPTLLHHLNDVPTAALSSATVGKIEIFNDSPFIIDGAVIRKGTGDFPGTWSSENPGGTPQDITSSGEFLYAALGAAGIARRDTSGAWSIWQATPLATRIAWVKNRIMASDGTTVYEITDIVRTVETLPAGWIFEAIFEAGGFIYAVANNASSGLSRISTYGLNTAGDAIEKKNETPFPRNQLMYSGRGFLGSVYIGGGIKNSSEGFDPVVYQAFPQDSGALTYLKVNEGEGAGSVDLSVKALEPIGEDIVFGWSLGSGFDFGARDGLAIHKPKVDAFLGYLKKAGPGAGRQVLGIALYRGRLLFSLKGDGLYYEDTSHFVSQAQLWTSVADWQTTTKKSWDTIQISHNRLPLGTSVRAEYSTRLPSEGAWNPGVLSNVTDSEVAESGFTDITSQMISLRLTSAANGAKTLAPSGLGFLVRSNVIPDHPEFGLTRYVRLVNKDRKDSDAPMVFNDVAAVRRKLHNLAYQWVTLYEPGVIWTLHVDSVSEVQPFLVEYDATLGEGQAQGYVVQLVMTGTRD